MDDQEQMASPDRPEGEEADVSPLRPSLRGRGRQILLGESPGEEESARKPDAPAPAALPAPPPAGEAPPRPSLRGVGARLFPSMHKVAPEPEAAPPVPDWLSETEARVAAEVAAPEAEPGVEMETPDWMIAAALEAPSPISPHEAADITLAAAEARGLGEAEAVPAVETALSAPVIVPPAPSVEPPTIPAEPPAETYTPPPEVAALTPDRPEALEAEAVPLYEMFAPGLVDTVPAPEIAVPTPVTAVEAERYTPPPEVEALTPARAETLETEATPAIEADAFPPLDLAPAPEAATPSTPLAAVEAERYSPPPEVAALTPTRAETLEPEATPTIEAGAPPPLDLAPAPEAAAPSAPLAAVEAERYAPPPEVEALTPTRAETLETEATPATEADAFPPLVLAPAPEAAPSTPLAAIVEAERYTPPPEVAALTPTRAETLEAEGEPSAVVSADEEEPLPLGDWRAGPGVRVEAAAADADRLPPIPAPHPAASSADYVPAPEIEALTPLEPESAEAAEPLPEPDLDTLWDEMLFAPAVAEEPAIDATELAAVAPPDIEAPARPLVTPIPVEQAAEPALEPEPEAAPAPDLVEMGRTGAPLEAPPAQPDPRVSEADVGRLLAQIDALQEQIARASTLDPGDVATYQQELLYADHWLRQGSAYYHSTRAIVYRVRAALNRAAQMREWSRRYSRRLFVYLTLAAVIVVALGLVQGPATEVGAQIGMTPPVVGAYMPMLFGALGAVFGALWALIEQLFIKHDFDPTYVAWYFLTPLIGLLTGVAVYAVIYALVVSVINTDAGPMLSTTPYLVWALSFIVGMAALLIWGRPRRPDERARPSLDLPDEPEA